MSKDYTTEAIAKQTDAAAFLVESLGEDDAILIHDTVEGETGFFEAIEVALDEIAQCDIICEGVAAKVKQLTDRKTRADKRRKKLRGLIEQAFTIAGQKNHIFDVATVTLKNTPPQCIVDEESDVPSRFWVEQSPKLDRRAMAEAMKSGEDVKGAHMTNGGTTLQIKWT